ARVAFRRARVNPLNLRAAIGPAYPAAGFSAIVGNPPYVRIQVMREHFSDQLEYLQNASSGYESPLAHNFDLYQVFVERAVKLLAPAGRLGYIIPHRFTNHLSASAIRNVLSKRIERLVHFGEEQAFPGRTTYVAIINAGPQSTSPVTLELVKDLTAWREN
ncbi:TPA: Eco57I restriction-modification methylase domain-containing protein, partial [Shigella sonnei]|nr:Eco57I restriction-modification methylase domain-containing protein [Shigella sonnei]